jgi:hypothetical protein
VDDHGILTRVELKRDPKTNMSSIISREPKPADEYRCLGTPLLLPWLHVPITLFDETTSMKPEEVKLEG